MSIRASLISFLLRHTIKKQFSNFNDPVELRELANGGGSAELPAEVRLSDLDAGGIPAEWVDWSDVDESYADESEMGGSEIDGSEIDSSCVLLYFHGGGYVFGSPAGHRDLAWRLSQAAGVRVLMVGYRLAPENPFPCAVDDATNSYRWLLDQGFGPDHIFVGGDSAGGGLAMALMVNLKNLGLPQPKAAVLISPWVDLASTGDSVKTNSEADAMLSPEALSRMAHYYLGDRDPKAPLASPLYADLSGLPPMHVLVGSTEVLLSDSESLVDEVTKVGGSATISIWPKMPHVFPLLAARIPEGKEAVTEIGEFLKAAKS